MDYEFHRYTIKEMLRVSSKEIRMFPLVGLNGKRSKFIDAITKDDLLSGTKTEILKMPYEFIRGGNEMVKIICV